MAAKVKGQTEMERTYFRPYSPAGEKELKQNSKSVFLTVTDVISDTNPKTVYLGHNFYCTVHTVLCHHFY